MLNHFLIFLKETLSMFYNLFLKVIFWCCNDYMLVLKIKFKILVNSAL